MKDVWSEETVTLDKLNVTPFSYHVDDFEMFSYNLSRTMAGKVGYHRVYTEEGKAFSILTSDLPKDFFFSETVIIIL